MSRLHILLVEDDAENLALLKAILPTNVNGEELTWHACSSFEEAYEKLQRQRYDMVVTDVYRDRKGEDKHHLNVDEAQGTNMLALIRAVRFCPVIFFSDGSQPENIRLGPFVRFVDKVKTERLITEINDILATSIPTLAAKLHDELDRAAGSYLWTFLEEQWQQLGPTRTTPAVLERLIRRRAAVQLGHLNPAAPEPIELSVVEGAEFYLYPSIAGQDYRLGDIIQQSEEFRVILTPHCYLTTQPKATAPRADYVVTVKTVRATELIGNHPFKGNEQERDDRLRRYLNSPAEIGAPPGRYWFLPEFLAIPNLYCDFLQLESITLANVKAQHTRVATLASPFSEALQACYLKFYTAVGLPTLQPEGFAPFKAIVATPPVNAEARELAAPSPTALPPAATSSPTTSTAASVPDALPQAQPPATPADTQEQQAMPQATPAEAPQTAAPTAAPPPTT